MHRLRFGDSLHIFLHEFIEHLFHALGSWTFNFYFIAPLFHSNLPVAALIRHEQNTESGRVLSSNYGLRKETVPLRPRRGAPSSFSDSHSTKIGPDLAS